MGRRQNYLLARVNLIRTHTDYIRGCIDGFEAGRNKLIRFLYKHEIIKEPPMIRVCRKILAERKDLTERLTPS